MNSSHISNPVYTLMGVLHEFLIAYPTGAYVPPSLVQSNTTLVDLNILEGIP